VRKRKADGGLVGQARCRRRPEERRRSDGKGGLSRGLATGDAEPLSVQNTVQFGGIECADHVARYSSHPPAHYRAQLNFRERSEFVTAIWTVRHCVRAIFQLYSAKPNFGSVAARNQHFTVRQHFHPQHFYTSLFRAFAAILQILLLGFWLPHLQRSHGPFGEAVSGRVLNKLAYRS
jgi:hypothetical protein